MEVVVVHFEYKKNFLKFFSQIYSQANSTRSSTTSTQAKRFKWSENEHKKNASLKEREREQDGAKKMASD